MANQLIRENSKDWENDLSRAEKINWTRENPDWEGRAMTGGRLTTGGQHPAWTRNYLKLKMGLALNDEEKKLEGFLNG